MHIEVVIPVFNDWASVAEVIQRLDQAFATSEDSISIMLIDDGSTVDWHQGFSKDDYRKLSTVSVLKLKKNLGHQRALAVGICYLVENMRCDAALVMDGDGEDKPEDAVRLVERLKMLPKVAIVFAERTRRSESLDFRLGYLIYKLLHYALTGLSIRVGNFSIIPAFYLPAVIIEPMLWNHYAASVIRARLPIETIPTERGVRVTGRSRLNFVGLVVHGLSALACYSEIIGVRLIIASGGVLFLAFMGLVCLGGIRLFTTMAIPGWTSLSLGLLIVVILQVITLVSNFTMQVITGRSIQPFLPARDYSWFVSNLVTLYKSSP